MTQDLPNEISIRIKMLRQKHEAKMVNVLCREKEKFLDGAEISEDSVKLSHSALEMVCVGSL